jgi:methyl-accepting chemotaxis protein
MFRLLGLQHRRKNLKALIADTEMLANAGMQGNLNTRVDALKHKGDYRKIVQGINNMLDAIIDPLNLTARYVDKLSKGEIPEKITTNYNGDFKTIIQNLNALIAATNSITESAKLLAKGDLTVSLIPRSENDELMNVLVGLMFVKA